MGAPLMLGVMPLIPLSQMYAKLGIDGYVGVVAAVATVVSCGCSLTLQRMLHSSKLLTFASHLPMTDREIARKTWLAAVTWFSAGLYPALLAFGYLAWAETVGPDGWCLALAIALGQWLVIVALGTMLAVYQPRFPCMTVLLLFVIAVPMYFYAGAPRLPVVARIVYAATPAGWLNAVFKWAYLDGMAWGWWVLVPVGLVIATGSAGLGRLAATYTIRELTVRPGSRVLAHSNLWAAATESLDCWLFPGAYQRIDDLLGEKGAPLSENLAIRKIRERTFLSAATERRQGMVDRLVRRFLTQREANLLDFMTAEGSEWSYFYGVCTATALVFVAMDWIAPDWRGKELSRFMPFVSFMLVTLLHTMGWSWLAFCSPVVAGACVPRYALLPVGFDEVSRLMAKVACIRGPLLLPLVIAPALRRGVQFDVTLLVWLLASVGGVCLYVMAQGWCIGVIFGETMRLSDARLKSPKWLAARVVTCGLGVLFVVLTLAEVGAVAIVALVVLLDARVALPYLGGVAVLAFALSSLGCWLTARRMYRSGPVDLVRSTPSLGQQLFDLLGQTQHQLRLARELGRRRRWTWFRHCTADDVRR
jgi:hypothetical protein